MCFGLSHQTRRILLRSAAIAVVGGLAAGCSSNVQRFQDSLFTGSSSSTAAVAPVSQPYPGDQQVAGVDQTYTGSVSRNGQRGAPVPAATVGGGQPVYQAQAQQSVYQQPQPVYASQGVAASPVGRATLAPPSGSQMAAAPQVKQPAPTLPASNALPAPAQPAPQQPDQTQVAVLPQTPKVGDAGQTEQPQAAPAPGASGGASYTVASGDTLSAISRRTGVSADAIKRANNLDSGLIRIGQTLTIPGASAQSTTQVASAAPKPDPVVTNGTVAPQKPTETAQPQAAAYAPSSSAQQSVEAAVKDGAAVAPDSTGVGKMRWPVRGRVISNFGSAQSGDGIDISVPQGTPVMAAENGVVIYAGDGLKEFGNTVLVRHDNGLVTVYGHASDLKVARGEKVTRGQQIATSGMSGNADAPKLRFEVRKDSAPVNPASYLE
ncbi:MAG: peptidoglycan DD-metalloendopeptidase family protein [Aliihoeflea sp.]